MKRQLSDVQNPIVSDEDAERCFLSVVIVCEDTDTTRQAVDTYGQMVLLAGPDFEFQSHIWRADYLEFPKLRETAAIEATQADIIIFAAHSSSKISVGITQWLGAWCDSRAKRPGALIELLDAPDDETRLTSPIHLRLRVAAYRTGLEFFSKPVGRSTALDEWKIPPLPQFSRTPISSTQEIVAHLASM